MKMKKGKREILVLAAIVGLLATISVTAVLSAQDAVVSIESCGADVGKNVTVPVMIKDIPVNIMTADVTLIYNKSVVNVVSVSDSDFYSMLKDIKNEEGYTRIIAYHVGAPLIGDVKLADVTLMAVGNAGETSPLDFIDVYLEDGNGAEIPAVPENGTFTIQETTPPIVINPRAEPMIIPDDTDNEPLWGELAELMVNVTDESGIASVTVNLSDLGWGVSPMVNQSRCLQYGICAPSVAVLTCIGNYSADGTTWVPFNFSTNASAGTTGWNGSAYVPFCLPVNATDIYGNSNTSVCINLTVMKNGDVTGDGKVMMGDGVRIINHVFYPGDPSYSLPSDTIADVTGDGKVMMGDGVRIINHVFYPQDPSYILK